MSFLLSWDPSELKLLSIASDDGRYLKLCSSCCTKYSGNDCCCYLDPETPEWQAGVEYELNAVVQGYYGIHVCRNPHLSSEDNKPYRDNTQYWTKLSDEVPCGNDSWASIESFGGVGKSPLYYTALVSGVESLYSDYYPNINGTWLLTHISGCVWRGTRQFEMSDGPKNVYAELNLRYLCKTEYWTQDDQGNWQETEYQWYGTVFSITMDKDSNDWLPILFYQTIEPCNLAYPGLNNLFDQNYHESLYNEILDIRVDSNTVGDISVGDARDWHDDRLYPIVVPIKQGGMGGKVDYEPQPTGEM